ncbi:MAG: tetratricopeptide repeat protein, partial [Rhodothermales bacterium]|nr:tetratricopeptide repeat protein [Rhodothermales bacterium]
QNNIANLMLTRGDTLGAVQRYETLLSMDSTLADVWLNLGTVYALSGDFIEARSAWEAALRHDPQHPEARQYLSQLPPG